MFFSSTLLRARRLESLHANGHTGVAGSHRRPGTEGCDGCTVYHFKVVSADFRAYLGSCLIDKFGFVASHRIVVCDVALFALIVRAAT